MAEFRSLSDLIESGTTGYWIFGNIRVKRLHNGVLSVNSVHGLSQPQVDVVKEMLHFGGYKVTESWVATQGVSWLSSGVFAGLSMRIEKI